MDDDRFPTRFKKGLVPWNKGRKGISYPGMEATQFKPGHNQTAKYPIGTERIRTRKRDGQQQVWVKFKDDGHPRDWQYRSRFVWELHNGPIPKGYVIHKIDDDSMNDAIENLQLMTRAEHMKHHEADREPSRLAGIAQAVRTRRETRLAKYDKYYWEFEAEADQELEESYVRPS